MTIRYDLALVRTAAEAGRLDPGTALAAAQARERLFRCGIYWSARLGAFVQREEDRQ